ncbi:nuclear transport factor 2 family protein [Flavobacterium sp.]|uniref:nuclear transport factor 2 family protein n=1 Tax=Flavobacterium sp. TaxID=239 RepID=UPI0039E33B77
MRIPFPFLALLLFGSLSAQNKYVPDDPVLYQTIVRLDSVFFDAYNHCDNKLKVYGDFYAENLEFYHDKGGLSTSKKETVEATKKNICGKVTRHLKPGSIEVYPIKDWGAIEMGLHQFRNKAEPDAVPHDSKFIIFWHNDHGNWKIEKVVSLH